MDLECRRLARLHRLAIMDTEPEPAFDSAVRLAAFVCGTPIALVSLIDDQREWFKANLGLPSTTQWPRASAFCDPAMQGADIMEVPDALLDPRFVRNPLVTGEPRIRFYAAAPIAMPDGEFVGTISVIDRQPRRLSDVQRAALRDLAIMVSTALLRRERTGAATTEGNEADSSQRLRTEAQLREANGFLERAEQMAGVGGWEADLVTGAAKWTPQTCRIHDLPLDYQPALSDYKKFFEGKALQFLEETAARAITLRESWDVELPLVTAKGRSIWIRSVGRAEFEGNRAVRLVGATQDITEQKNIERELRAANALLRESEERQRRALDASRLVLWDFDLTSGTILLSANWSEMLGGPSEPTETTFEALTQIVPQEDQARLVEAMVPALKSEKERYAVEHRVRRHDGSFIWIHSEGRVTMRDPQGQALHAAGTNHEITARKQTEDQLKRAAAITTSTLESTADGILVVGSQREILLFNRRFVRLWNIPPELEQGADAALLGHAIRQLKDPEVFLARVNALYDAVDEESFDLLPLTDGRVFERYSRPMIQDGRAAGRVWSFRDVTERQLAQDQARRAKEAAEAESLAKSDFLATVSHEIRTPLNGVIGLTRLLLAEPLTPKQRKYAELIDTSGQSLMTLVSDVLDLKKIESGRIEADTTTFNLPQMFAALDALYAVQAAERQLAFHSAIAPDVPAWLSGDPNRLRQVLDNLLSNSFKFTQAGEVALTVELSAAQAARVILRFEVRDTGIGISSDDQSRLFTRYFQAGPSITRRFGGTGLGLAIVKQLTELMGGVVGVASAPGRGSVFTLDIPFDLPAAEDTGPVETVAATHSRKPRSGRILVVDDSRTNRMVAQGFLARLGFTDSVALDDGEKAVQAVMAGGFAAVLLDCHMPVLDGFATARQLRSLGCDVPIIALTALASTADRENCLNAGMDDYLSKPLDAGRLAQVLDRWLPASQETQASSSEATPAFDRDAVERGFEGDDTFYRAVVGSFIDDARTLPERVELALASAQPEVLHRHFHSLAGAAATVGAAQVCAQARMMERWADEGDLAAISREMPKLGGMLSAFATAVGFDHA